MKIELTERQQEILTFIQEFRDASGYPPTLREIGKRFGISSTFGVKRHLEALVKKGYLNIESNASRGISFLKNDTSVHSDNVVLEKNEIFNKIPIIGRVAAGSPILAVENIEGSIVVDPSFMNKAQDTFALRVKGNSMINAGIYEGDLVIISPQKIAQPGNIIVAMLDDEVTVKTFSYKNGKVQLLPENNEYKPIDIDSTREFSILGKVIGVVRWLN